MSFKIGIAMFVLIGLLFLSCASLDEYNQPIDPSKATPTPTPPKPAPTPKQPVQECRITNNEGRIFTVQASTQAEAEGKARRECQRTYRHCTLLKCDLVMPEGN